MRRVIWRTTGVSSAHVIEDANGIVVGGGGGVEFIVVVVVVVWDSKLKFAMMR